MSEFDLDNLTRAQMKSNIQRIHSLTKQWRKREQREANDLPTPNEMLHGLREWLLLDLEQPKWPGAPEINLEPIKQLYLDAF